MSAQSFHQRDENAQTATQAARIAGLMHAWIVPNARTSKRSLVPPSNPSIIMTPNIASEKQRILGRRSQRTTAKTTETVSIVTKSPNSR